MNSSLRISLLVHGYPPFEQAGTEQHTAMLATELEQQGHIVQIICATRSPTHQHAEKISFGHHRHRIVNNIPSRPLSEKECDPIIRDLIQELWQSFSPDIIHIQHLMFLSTDLSFPVPTFLTLHDAWMWCASGGQERELHLPKNQNTICSGPQNHKCAQCSSKWAPQLPKRGRALIKTAQFLRPVVSVQQLNRIWKNLPHSIRKSFSISTKKEFSSTPHEAQQRNLHMHSFAQNFQEIFAPSQYLANRATKYLDREVKVIRHGPNTHREHIGGKGFVFIGGIAVHKGPHIVQKAHQKSCFSQIPLRFYGPMHDPTLIAEKYWCGIRSNQEILDILQNSDALIMGSIWPENAPLVITEALSVGCPVIAPRIGGIPEMIRDGENGLLYSAGDVEDLAAKIAQYRSIKKLDRRPQLFSHITRQYVRAYKSKL